MRLDYERILITLFNSQRDFLIEKGHEDKLLTRDQEKKQYWANTKLRTTEIHAWTMLIGHYDDIIRELRLGSEFREYRNPTKKSKKITDVAIYNSAVSSAELEGALFLEKIFPIEDKTIKNLLTLV